MVDYFFSGRRASSSICSVGAPTSRGPFYASPPLVTGPPPANIPGIYAEAYPDAVER